MASEIDGRRYWLAMWAAPAACGLLYLLASYYATRAGITLQICPLKAFTGIPCPFCGGTRAALALLQGNFHAAFLLNPLAVTLCLFGPLAYVIHQFLLRHRWQFQMTRVLWILLGAIIGANWFYLIWAGR